MTKPGGPPNAKNLWRRLRSEAAAALKREPELAPIFVHILGQDSFDDSLASCLAGKLAGAAPGISYETLFPIFRTCCAENSEIAVAARRDLLAVMERDPVATDIHTPFLYFKGYQAIQTQRVAHHLWHKKRRDMALYLQSRSSEIFQVDIHPAARLGHGIMMDHATGIVIGETAVVGDDVSLLHSVTLGGTGKEGSDRHPKIRRGVMIGAGAKILGNIEIGEGARVAAGSVVTKPVPPHVTVAGVPACVIGKAGSRIPAKVMEQAFEPEAPKGPDRKTPKTPPDRR